jgi:PAS domain S-box-containing protein
MLLLLAIVVIVAGGYAYYRHETDRIQQGKYQELAAIAKLKAGQVVQWRQGLLDDAEAVAKGPMFNSAINEWLRDGVERISLKDLTERLVVAQRAGGYADALLLDLNGKTLLSARPQPEPMSPGEEIALQGAITNHSALLTDLHRTPHGALRMTAVAPLLDPKGATFAVVFLRSDPESVLFPLIQSWPTPSSSAETLLVRRDGDDVLFLNELRHRRNTALFLRQPVTLGALPGVQAILGSQGMFQGTDYRGAEVLADLRPIPDSPWFMVTKVDAEEILAEARYRGVITALLVAVFVLLAGSATAYWFTNRQARIYRSLYQSEKDQREAYQRFRTILYSIGDAVISTDTRGLVQQMNREASSLTGWSEEEAVGRPLEQVFRIVNEKTRQPCENPVQKILRTGEMVGLANRTALIARDGTEKVLADSGAPIRGEDGQLLGVVLVFRDVTERAKVQEALRLSESFLNRVIELSPYPMWISDDQGTLIRTNKALRDLLSISDEEIVGKYNILRDNIVEEQGFLPLVKNVYANGETARFVIKYDTSQLEGISLKDSAAAILDVTMFAITDSDGRITNAVIQHMDITERNRAEDQLRRAEQRYRSLFEEAPFMYVITRNEQGAPFVSDCNNYFLGVLGYERQEVQGKPLAEFYSPESRKALLEGGGYSRALAGEFAIGERQLVTRDGRIVPTLLYTARELDGSGNVIGTRAMFVDITDRKHAEASLLQAKHDWEDTFNSIEDMITIHDREFNIIASNTSAQRILDLPDLITPDGVRCYQYYHGKDCPPEVCPSCLCLQTGQPAMFEIFEPHLNMFIEVRAIPRFDANGELKGLIHIVRDITKRKQEAEEKIKLHQQLLQAQKMEAIGTLAGGVAHDFNNILQVALGYSELMLGEEDFPDRYRSDLKRIHESAKRGADLVQRLLTFSRKAEVKPLTLDLNRRISELRKMLERTIPKMINIRLNLADDLAPVNADPTQIDQVLMNLAVNARDAMPDGGELVFETANIFLDEDYVSAHVDAKPGLHVLLTVTDTGLGMDRDTLEHIFEPFYTTKDVGEGTGLGLAMVHGIVNHHGGHIWCYSELGEGSTFRIYLPALESQVKTDAETTGLIPAFGTETVLLVDDEEFIRELGARILTKHGYTVLQAVNGKDALDIFERERSRISLVILDVIMPVMDGGECLCRLLEIDPDVKVIVASGFSADSMKDTFRRSAKGMASKPFRPKELLRAVRRALGES